MTLEDVVQALGELEVRLDAIGVLLTRMVQIQFALTFCLCLVLMAILVRRP